jgi:hypothetical protein
MVQAVVTPHNQSLFWNLSASVEAIRTHQRLRGGTQDGRVSVAKANNLNRGQYDGQHVWMIFPLNNSMIDRAPDIYARIDLHPQSGPAVSATVKKICLHGG